METLTIDLKKKKSFEIGQQGDHNALCIHFINMKNVGTNKKYIYYTIDGIENCVPLTNDRFIIGYPLTAHSGIASAQLISKLNDNSIIKLSNVFAMHIKESKGYKDSGEYPVDPNIQSSYDLLDDLINETKDLINNYNYATLMEKLTQASSEATTSAATAKKCADELKDSTDFINTLDEKVAAQDSKIEKIEASTSHITTKQNTKIAALQTRMSEFTSLKDGSTTGDAELIDARIGADGTKYHSAGDAMRGQVEKLNKVLGDDEKLLWDEVSGYTTSVGYVDKDGLPITDTSIGNYTSFIIIPPNVTNLKIVTDANKLGIHSTLCFYSYFNYLNFISYEKFDRDSGVVSVPDGAYYFIVNCDNPINLHIYYNKIRKEYKNHIDLRDFLPTSKINSKTDISEQLQEAVDYCHKNFIPLYIPNKNFLVEKPITVYPNTHIIGDGIYGETKQKEPNTYTIKYTGSGSMFSNPVATASLLIDGCIFVGSKKANSCIMINGETTIVKNCTFYSFLNAIKLSNTKGSWTGEIKIHDNIFAIGYSGITVKRAEGKYSDINDWEIYNNIFIANTISFECDFADSLKYFNNHDYSTKGIVVYNNSSNIEIFNNYFDNGLTSIKAPFQKQLNRISNNIFLLHVEDDADFSVITTSNNYNNNAYLQVFGNLVSGEPNKYINSAFITIANDFTNDNALTINQYGNSIASVAKGIVNNSDKVVVN